MDAKSRFCLVVFIFSVVGFFAVNNSVELGVTALLMSLSGWAFIAFSNNSQKRKG